MRQKFWLIKFFFIVTVMLQFWPSYGQKYGPILGDSAKWYVDVEFNNYGDTSIAYRKLEYTIVYYTEGDSTVNAESYKKMFISDPFASISGGVNGFVGLIREDTIAERIFFLYKDSLKEKLIYDFKVLSGDSLYLTFWDNQVGIQNWMSSGYYFLGVFPDTNTKVFRLASKKMELFDDFSLIWDFRFGSVKGPLYFFPPYNLYDGNLSYKVKLVCYSLNGDLKVSRGCDCPCLKKSVPASMAEASKERYKYIPAKFENGNILLFTDQPLEFISNITLSSMGGVNLELPATKLKRSGTIAQISLPPYVFTPGIYILQLITSDKIYLAKLNIP